MSETEQKLAKNKAKRALQRAKRTYNNVRKFLDPSINIPDESELEPLEEPIEMDEIGMEEDAEEETKDENQEEEDQEKETSVKRVLMWWKRCLDQIRWILEQKFDCVLADVQDFLKSFWSEQKMIQDNLDERWKNQEVEKMIKKCKKQLKFFASAVKRKNMKSAQKERDNLEDSLHLLKHEFVDNATAASFVISAEMEISSLEEQWAQRYELKEAKELKRNSDLEKFREKVKKIRLNVQQSMDQLNAQVSKRLVQTQQEADITTSEFLKH